MRGNPPPSRGRLQERRSQAELDEIEAEFARVRSDLLVARIAAGLRPVDPMVKAGNARLRLQVLRLQWIAEVRRLRRDLFGGPQLMRRYGGCLEVIDLVSGEVLGIEVGHPNLAPTLVLLAHEIAQAIADASLEAVSSSR